MASGKVVLKMPAFRFSIAWRSLTNSQTDKEPSVNPVKGLYANIEMY